MLALIPYYVYLHYSDRVTSHALTLELNANDFGRNEKEKEHLKNNVYISSTVVFIFAAIPKHSFAFIDY